LSLAALASLVLSFVFSAGGFCTAAERVPAFPGAEGFGAFTPGGRGGKVILVTNLKDYIPGEQEPIPGSFRAACLAEGPRIVVFRVAGTIPLESGLEIRNPFITIAGQTAPGDGICTRDWDIQVETHDVIIRHLRCRTGDTDCETFRKKGREGPDALSVYKGSQNVIFDHCSASWGIDETLSVSSSSIFQPGEGITNVTVQWCIVSEGLDHRCYKSGSSMGSLLRCNGNVSFHHNLLAHNRSRNPFAMRYGEGRMLLDFRNNVIYPGGGDSADLVDMNYVGNYIKGPANWRFRLRSTAARVYGAGNYLLGSDEANRDNWKMFSGADLESSRMHEPFAVAPVATHSAQQAYEKVLATAGATLPKRDAVDQRIVDQVRNGTGQIIKSQKDVGGWPELRQTPPPDDSDNDGMPDDWEEKHGFNPQNPSDNSQDKDGDGYTNIEEWINSTHPLTAEKM